MSLQLPRCPKCGGKAKLDRGLPNMGNSKKRFAFVRCLACNFRTPTLYPRKGEPDTLLKERAVKEWYRLCATEKVLREPKCTKDGK